MKFTPRFFILLMLVSGCIVAGTPTFLLQKSEFKYLHNNNQLVSEAIKNTFGIPQKQNYYKLHINQVDAWTSSITEFKYYPGVNGDQNKNLLLSSVNNAKEPLSIKIRIRLDAEKSVLNDQVKKYVDERNSILINLVVLHEAKTFIFQPANKAAFNEIVNEKSYIEQAFLSYFGSNPRNSNYNIYYETASACFLKDPLKSACLDKIQVNRTLPNDEKLSNKVTSEDMSGGFILFEVPVKRERSQLSPAIEEALVKKEDGSEALQFYFCVPEENVRPKKRKKFNIEGKMLSQLMAPLHNINVYLRDHSNTVISSQRTSANGSFKFADLEEGYNYSLMLDNTVKEQVVLLSNKKDSVLAEMKRSEIGFEYKLIPAVIANLIPMEVTEPVLETVASIKGKMLAVTDKTAGISNQLIALRNAKNEIISSQTTDESGNFEFKNVNPSQSYQIDLPNYKAATAQTRVYLANHKNELIREFKRDKNNKFSYKLIEADVFRLSSMNEEDVELSFNSQKSARAKEIVIQEFVHYSLNSTDISAESKKILDKVVVILKNNAGYHVNIVSHTDARGSAEDNLRLSEMRSAAVREYLIKSGSIAQNRLTTTGKGESVPLNDCSDGNNCIEEEHGMNRRTEFVFKPL